MYLTDRLTFACVGRPPLVVLSGDELWDEHGFDCGWAWAVIDEWTGVVRGYRTRAEAEHAARWRIGVG